MILVCVSDDDAFYLIFYLANVVEVWDEDIHAVHALAWKAHADINDDGASFCLKDRHIAADLAKTAKWSYANFMLA